MDALDYKEMDRLGKLLIIEDKYIMFATKHFYMADGAILMSPNATSGRGITEELKEMLVKHVADNIIANTEDTRVLTISGTHGDQGGASALSEKDMAEYELYEDDCKIIGIVPYQVPDSEASKKPKNDWPDGIPPISDIKNTGGSNKSIQDDTKLNKMKFQVVNLGHYTEKEDRLIKDIIDFNPKM